MDRMTLAPSVLLIVGTDTGVGKTWTSCAAGVVVCNIDNGFGAAFAALRILQSAPRYRLESHGAP